jgi:hypothetical protein
MSFEEGGFVGGGFCGGDEDGEAVPRCHDDRTIFY